MPITTEPAEKIKIDNEDLPMPGINCEKLPRGFIQMNLSPRAESRRPYQVCTPLEALIADGTRRKVSVPAEGTVVVFADPKYRESEGYVRFNWGSVWLFADLATFRNSTRDLLRQT
jgi:hypothetical protein